jgi:hypothetical protein
MHVSHPYVAIQLFLSPFWSARIPQVLKSFVVQIPKVCSSQPWVYVEGWFVSRQVLKPRLFLESAATLLQPASLVQSPRLLMLIF